MYSLQVSIDNQPFEEVIASDSPKIDLSFKVSEESPEPSLRFTLGNGTKITIKYSKNERDIPGSGELPETHFVNLTGVN